MAVIVPGVPGQDHRRCRSPRIAASSRHSRRSVLTNRSANEFARGAGTGALINRVPFPEKTSSNCHGEFAVSVADQEPKAAHPLAEIHQEVAGLLAVPAPAGWAVGKDARRLNSQGLPPRRRHLARRETEPGSGQDPADCLSPTRYPSRAAHPRCAADPSAGSAVPAAPPAHAPRPRPVAVPAHSDRSNSAWPGPGQAPVPGHQGSRCHDPIQPQPTGQQPRQRGEYGTVSPIRPRARDLPTQDRNLIVRYQDLHILDGVTPCQEHQLAEHPDHEEIDEASEHIAERIAADQAHARGILVRRTPQDLSKCCRDVTAWADHLPT
jgi:hypothetical protein